MFHVTLKVDGTSVEITCPDPGKDIDISVDQAESISLSPQNAMLVASALIAAVEDHD